LYKGCFFCCGKGVTAINIFTLSGEILLRDDNVNSRLNEIDGRAERTGLSFAKMGAAVLAAGAVAVGAGFGLYKLAESASNLTEAQNVVETTFKTSGKAIEAWTETTAKSAGISKTSSTQWVGFMGAMLKSSGVSETSSASMSKNLVQLTGDMSSFYNVSTSDMWEKLRAGISGETEPLKAIGINMSVANLQAYALATGIKKPYAEMSQGEQTQLRYNYLMNVTKDAQGDFGKTLSTSFANQVRVAQLNMETLGQSIGTQLLPAFNSAVTWLNGNMPAIQATVGKAFDAIKIAIGDVSTALSVVINWAEKYKEILIPLGAGIAAAAIAFGIYTLAVSAMALATTIATGATTAFAAVLAFVTSPIGIVVIAIGLLVAAIVVLYRNWDTVKAKTTEVWNSIKTFLSNTWDGIKTTAINTFNAIKTFFQDTWNSIKTTSTNVWNSIKQFFSDTWSSIKSTITSVWNSIKQLFTDVINSIVAFVKSKFAQQMADIKAIFESVRIIFSDVWDAIKQIFLGALLLIIDLVTGNFTQLKSDANNIFNNLKNDFTNIWANIKAIFLNTVQAIQTTVSQIFTGLSNFMTSLWEGIKNTASSAWNWLKTTVVNLANSIVSGATNAWNDLKNFMSSLWEGIKNTAISAWNGLKSSVINTCNSLIQGAKDTFNNLLNWFRGLPGTLSNIGSNMFNSMSNGVSSAIGGLKNTIVNGVNGAVDFIKGFPAKMLGYGRDMIQGLINGITGMLGGVTKAVSGVGDKIRSFLHFSVPDEGPLTDYESWMPDFMTGMAKGIDANKFKVIDSIKNLASGMNVNANITPTSNGTQTASVSNNGSTGESSGSNIFHVTIDAHNIKDFTDVVNIFSRLPQVVRAGG